ncbi:MAG: hypothetical protein ABF887_08900 [Gluconobacter oxydans]|uniref:hypothetical protein n=1 Tax=Gluconobacter oxydans TaxID=442 RepID=UPI0039EC716F
MISPLGEGVYFEDAAFTADTVLHQVLSILSEPSGKRHATDRIRHRLCINLRVEV